MFFEAIQEQYVKQLPFVVYRKPNTTLVKALLQANDMIHHIKDFSETGFVFAPFDTSESNILIPFKNAEELEMLYSEKPVSTKSKELSFLQEEKDQHIDLVKKGVEEIKKGKFQKVVLSRQETINLSGFDFIQIFESLLNKYPLAFVYCWYHPKVGLWLGATPETLMKIEGNQFSMMALAGTQDYKGTLDVTWEEKEKQEQQIVTDFIVENLKPLVETVKVSDVETVKAGNLVHLKTMITANLKTDSFNLENLISVLHPTPAVCGMPKQVAKAFILENEHYKREFYTGYLGELNYEIKVVPRSGKRNVENRAYAITKKCTQLYVNLRCMQIKDNKASIYVGGGITESSNPEKEWEETVSKSKVIKTIL